MDVCINFSDKKTRQSQECGIRLSLAQIQDARVSQFIDIYSSFISPQNCPCSSLANRPHPMTSHNSNLVNQWRYILHQQTIFQLLLWAFLIPPKLEITHYNLKSHSHSWMAPEWLLFLHERVQLPGGLNCPPPIPPESFD